MKRILAIIYLLIAFLIIYFLQSNFFSWFNIAGIMPNLFIILTLFIGLYGGEFLGVFLGTAFGFFLDSVIESNIGPNMLMLAIIGLIAGIFSRTFSKENILIVLALVAIATILCESGIYIFDTVSNNLDFEITSFIKILAVELIYNVLLTIIFFPLIKKLGYKIEAIFKNQKVITKLF